MIAEIKAVLLVTVGKYPIKRDITAKKMFRKADGFAVVSTFLMDHIISLGVSAEKVIVTTNAADSGKFNKNFNGYFS